MNALWAYFWPVLVAGLVVGAIAGTIAFRRASGRTVALVTGVAATLALAALWHGPLGGADRFSSRVDRAAQKALQYYEMTKVSAHLQRGPLTRRVLLAGPADDFQRSELVRLMQQLPGVQKASWSPRAGGLPLIVEGALASMLGFLIGVLLAYFVELRRRYNAQWSW